MLVPIHASGVSAKIRRAPKRFQTADKKSVPIGRHLDLETRGGESAREGLACGRFLSSCTQRNVGGADSSGGQGCGRQRKEIRRCEAFRESRPIVCVEQDEVMEVAVGYEVQDCVCGMNPSFPALTDPKMGSRQPDHAGIDLDDIDLYPRVAFAQKAHETASAETDEQGSFGRRGQRECPSRGAQVGRDRAFRPRQIDPTLLDFIPGAEAHRATRPAGFHENRTEHS